LEIPDVSQKRYLNIAGALALVAAIQWILGIIVAESTYANYSVSQNFLSDLGATCHSGAGTSPCFIVQPSSIVFNSALFLLGLLSIAGAYLIYRALGRRLFPTLFGLFGVGTLLTGVFPETFIIVHELAALLAFVCGGIAVLCSVNLGLEMPRFFRYVSMLLGVLALAALIPVVFSGPFMRLNNDFGIGPGGMERMVAYPIVLWDLAFGAYLMRPHR
jgi:hypothetical membrane protein